MNKAILVFISCANVGVAKRIGNRLLKKRLAACVQIFGGVRSAYFWPPGKKSIEEAREAVLLVKTIESKWIALEREVESVHSYATPEIIAIPTAHITKKYYDWLLSELD